jgi:DNA-binding XRE family transcriptional regulator
MASNRVSFTAKAEFKQKREALGFTQKDLVSFLKATANMNITRQWIGQIERGVNTANTQVAYTLARALKSDINDIFESNYKVPPGWKEN